AERGARHQAKYVRREITFRCITGCCSGGRNGLDLIALLRFCLFRDTSARIPFGPAYRGMTNSPVLTGGPMPVEKLTAKFVREAKPNPGDERTIFWDEARPGFGLMVTPSGHKSWIVQYRAKRTSRRYTIGSVAKLDIEQAIRRARAIQGRVAEGADPVLEKRREAESDRNALKAVAERYLAREGGKLRSAAKRR